MKQETRLDRRRRVGDETASRQERAVLALLLSADPDEPPLTSEEIQPLLARLLAFETREELAALGGKMARAGKERDRVAQRLNARPTPRAAQRLQRLDDRLAKLATRHSGLYVQLLTASAFSDPQELSLVRGYLDASR